MNASFSRYRVADMMAILLANSSSSNHLSDTALCEMSCLGERFVIDALEDMLASGTICRCRIFKNGEWNWCNYLAGVDLCNKRAGAISGDGKHKLVIRAKGRNCISCKEYKERGNFKVRGRTCHECASKKIILKNS